MVSDSYSLYNVKRRVASLPPVSQEIFTEKVLSAKATSSAAAAKASYEKTCVACQKTFYSENSYQNHVKSSKHKLREVHLKQKDGLADDTSSVLSSTFSLGDPVNRSVAGESESTVSHLTDHMRNTAIDDEDGDGDDDMEEDGDGEEYSTSRCLFCRETSPDVRSNVAHMFKNHGMFIPEKEYLVDLEGLIRYLHAKITENNECLYCHAIKSSSSGIRTHMVDKGHCMIAFETEEEQIEIGQYYDFRSTYSDDEDDEMVDHTGGGVPVTSSDADEDGWETDDSSVASDDSAKSKSYRGSRPALQMEYELHLPSGRSVGHRSLAKYYRQNLHSYPTAEERAARQLAIENGTVEENDLKASRNKHRAIISRANGGLGLSSATDHQKQEALAGERRERTRAQRSERKYMAKVNRQANSQKHFRVSSLVLIAPLCDLVLTFRIGSPPAVIIMIHLAWKAGHAVATKRARLLSFGDF